MLTYEIHNGAPVFHCNACGKCAGLIESTSYVGVNRGCCWHFPTYDLADIKNMLAQAHEDFVRDLAARPNSTVGKYEIHARGIFMDQMYKEYVASKDEDDTRIQFDETLFFRICPFFGGPHGCGLDFELRCHACNLYLCREVIAAIDPEEYEPYARERKDYFAYCAYVDRILEEELRDHGVDLQSDLSEAIRIIADTEVPGFSPSTLSPLGNPGSNSPSIPA
jgi:hypothetical protein